MARGQDRSVRPNDRGWLGRRLGRPGGRAAVEAGLRDGRLRGVVCTSSLDLGVDFSPVDHVIHIGSPKGIARLMQPLDVLALHMTSVALGGGFRPSDLFVEVLQIAGQLGIANRKYEHHRTHRK